jgi:L-serine dehydratase
MYQFSTAQELLAMCEREKAGIAEVALRSEMEASGQAREYIWSRMEELYQVMQESIKNGLAPDRKTLGGLIGGNAYKLQQQMQKGCLSGQTVLKAASYALAVTEVNASMGKIIAAPTGGASGTLPGVIAAFIEDRKLGDEMAVQACWWERRSARSLPVRRRFQGQKEDARRNAARQQPWRRQR